MIRAMARVGLGKEEGLAGTLAGLGEGLRLGLGQ